MMKAYTQFSRKRKKERKRRGTFREEEEGYLWGGSVGEKDRDRVVGVSFACPKKDSTCVSYNIKKDYKNELCLLDN